MPPVHKDPSEMVLSFDVPPLQDGSTMVFQHHRYQLLGDTSSHCQLRNDKIRFSKKKWEFQGYGHLRFTTIGIRVKGMENTKYLQALHSHDCLIRRKDTKAHHVQYRGGLYYKRGDHQIKHAASKDKPQPMYKAQYIYIYIYAAGCLIEPPASTKMSRNLRKRSAKMIFGHPMPRRENCTPRGFN